MSTTPAIKEPTTRNRAFLAAFRKGVAAYTDGSACPYGDDRTWYGGVTFARAFNRYWHEGYDAAAEMHAKTGEVKS